MRSSARVPFLSIRHKVEGKIGFNRNSNAKSQFTKEKKIHNSSVTLDKTFVKETRK